MAHECLCPQCTDSPAPSYMEVVRFRGEVNHIVNMPKVSWRRRYLELVLKARGETVAYDLREELIKLGKLG